MRYVRRKGLFTCMMCKHPKRCMICCLCIVTHAYFQSILKKAFTHYICIGSVKGFSCGCIKSVIFALLGFLMFIYLCLL